MLRPLRSHPPTMDLPISQNASLITQAQIAGEHAQGWFLLTVALLMLLAVSLTTGSAAPLPVPPASTAAGPRGTPRLGLGVALILAACLSFAAIAHGVATGGAIVVFDRAFSDAVRASTSAPVLQVFEWVTRLGDGSTLAVLCLGGAGVLALRGERALAFGLVMAMGGNGLLNATLKRIFERFRPPHLQGMATFHGWSFPSGHSSGALVAYGMAAYLLMRMLPHRWHAMIVALAAGTAFSVGTSRIFLEAHYASDVAAGFASGTAWLTACIIVLELMRHLPSPIRVDPPRALAR